MIVIILAAGKGKRMRPLTDTRLKGSLPIQNQALLLKLTDMLNNSGIADKIILVISLWQLEDMKQLFEKTSYNSKINFAIQDPPKGTGDAVAQAESFMGDEQQCLVLNGDILAPIEEIIPRLISHHKKLQASCTMTVYPGKHKRYGLLQISEDGRVLDIKEKAKSEEITDDIGYINAGIYLFEREIFDIIRKTPLSERGEYEITDSISIQGEKGPIGAIITDSWMSIENPIDLFRAQQFVKPLKQVMNLQFHSGGEIGFKAAEDIFFDDETKIDFSSIMIKGPVLIGEGTLIETGSSIGPNVYLGRNCEIGANTSIRHSLIFDFCRIEKDCEITNLISGEELLIGKNTIINLSADDYLILGGKTIVVTSVEITKGAKIKAHSIIKKDTKVKSDY
jgi:bifunctional UDP-N-acetylglucosamine pyrophosphorylase/glucosamine-1-phosphate N-acetyltransferase